MHSRRTQVQLYGEADWTGLKIRPDTYGRMTLTPSKYHGWVIAIMLMTGLLNSPRVSKMPSTAVVCMVSVSMRVVCANYFNAYVSAATQCKGRALPHSMARC